MIQIKHTNNQSGFALLMTIIVVSVVLSVTLTIVDLSLKQLQLSSDTTESEIAFHASNAGLECARYTRNFKSSDFESGSPVNFRCFGDNSMVVGGAPSILVRKGVGFATPAVIGTDVSVFRYVKSISWGNPGSERCSEMNILTIMTSDTIQVGGSGVNSIKNLIPTYQTDTKVCETGSSCTIVSVTGYSSLCTATSSPGTLRREILLEF